LRELLADSISDGRGLIPAKSATGTDLGSHQQQGAVMLLKITLAPDTKITVTAAQCEVQLLILNTPCCWRETSKIVRKPHLAKREKDQSWWGREAEKEH